MESPERHHKPANYIPAIPSVLECQAVLKRLRRSILDVASGSIFWLPLAFYNTEAYARMLLAYITYRFTAWTVCRARMESDSSQPCQSPFLVGKLINTGLAKIIGHPVSHSNF